MKLKNIYITINLIKINKETTLNFDRTIKFWRGEKKIC
jgi:hypothetical protein